MNKFKIFNQPAAHLVIIALISILFGAGMQSIIGIGQFLPGFFAGTVLLFFASCLLYFAWRYAGKGKLLVIVMMLAFIVRVVYSVFLFWGLPQYGYETFTQRAGFVYEDAFRRERHAWDLANSEGPIAQAFQDVYETDQYGGLLALSAFVYRYISPDAFRPYLISILAAAAMSLSIAFLMAALKTRFPTNAANWAGWILALYPEGILLSASQMREPFIILLFTVLFWAVMNLIHGRISKLSILSVILSALFLMAFSFRVGGLIIGFMVSFVWVVISPKIPRLWVRITGWILMVVALGIAFWAIRDWMSEVIQWDALMTVSRSGRIQFQLSELPEFLHFPFIFIYGLLQPVLPAAVAAPAPWIWQSLGIFRALGWYLMLPTLFYAIIQLWRLKPSMTKRILLALTILVLAAIFIASARAGGDQWDNPRYRTAFLPWMAIISAWAINHACVTKDRWLARGFAIEGIFILVFTQWYLSRYYRFMPRLNLWLNVGSILILSLAIIIFGWVKDRKRYQLTEKNDYSGQEK